MLVLCFIYSDKTWVFDQSEGAQGPIYILNIIMVFLAANCRCELKAKMACSVGSRIISNSWQNSKVMNMSRTILLLVLTLAFVFASCPFSDKSDYLTWKWHPNKIYIRFLCLSYGSVKLL